MCKNSVCKVFLQAFFCRFCQWFCSVGNFAVNVNLQLLYTHVYCRCGMVQTCMQLSNGIAIFTRIPALQFFCVLCEILQETTRFFTFSKNCFCVAIQKKRLFCVLRFDRYTYKQFALGYLLRCALFAFREFCKKQHAFSHSQKIVFVSQFKKTFVLCFAV